MGFGLVLKHTRGKVTLGKWESRGGSPPEGEKVVTRGDGILEPGGCFIFVGCHWNSWGWSRKMGCFHRDTRDKARQNFRGHVTCGVML